MRIFVLRGLVREKGHWGEFPKELQQAFPNASIITPEIKGVGEYYKEISNDNFFEMVEFMREKFFINAPGEGPNYIMAMSLGGMIARTWMEKYPEDFTGAILVNTSFKGINSLFERLQPKSILSFLKIFANPSLEKRERLIVEMVANDKSKYDKVAAEWIEIQKARPVRRKSFVMQIKAALSYTPPKEKPKARLLWLASKGDRLCSYKSSLKLQKLWGGDMYLHETAGHDFPIDDTPWLVEKMKTWIEKEK